MVMTNVKRTTVWKRQTAGQLISLHGDDYCEAGSLISDFLHVRKMLTASYLMILHGDD